MQLAELKPGLALVGLEPDLVCTVVAVNVIADGAVQVFYKLPDGTIKERLLGTRPTRQPLPSPRPNAPGPSMATAPRSSSPAKPNASTSRFCSTR